MNLADFPLEILKEILSNLHLKDLLCASEVCKSFYEAANIDSVWHRRCARDFHASSQVGNFPFKELYQKVFYSNRHLLGVWQADIVAYGGLLLVKCVSDGVEGSELSAPRDPRITDPLRVKPLFRICLAHDVGSTEPAIIIAHSCIGQPNAKRILHSSAIDLVGPDTFQFQCTQPETHLNPSGRQQDFLAWLREEQGGPSAAARPASPGPFLYNEELLLMKFLSLRHHNYHYNFERLDLLPRPSLPNFGEEPLPPGLFNGTYGAHGIEIIHLTYEVSSDGQPKARALKITGDPNVPAKEVTFHVNLNYPICLLTQEEQNTIAKLETLQLEEVPFAGCSQESLLQPFVVPTDCFERFQGVPNVCKHRFHGWGQIAGHGFTNPSFSKGHWVVFNDDLFGFLWLELLSLSMFHRIKDLDPSN